MGDLLDNYVRLRDAGILPHGCLDHGMTMSFYYPDPDGNSVELQFDEFGDWSKSTEWMTTSPQFDANPIGTPVDPEQIIAARDAGATPQEIHERALRRRVHARRTARPAAARARVMAPPARARS